MLLLIDPLPETIDQVPTEGAPDNVLVSPSVIEAVVVVLFATTSQTGVTVKVTSAFVAGQSPSAAIIYLIVTVVFVLMFAGVYMLLLIDPLPETIDQVPPVGFPDNVLVSFSVIEVVDVKLTATIKQTGVTVKVTSAVVAGQSPSAAIVYLIVTVVFVLMFVGV
jgi:hypothetical protein